jgi:hypothetical protein
VEEMLDDLVYVLSRVFPYHTTELVDKLIIKDTVVDLFYLMDSVPSPIEWVLQVVLAVLVLLRSILKLFMINYL